MHNFAFSERFIRKLASTGRKEGKIPRACLAVGFCRSALEIERFTRLRENRMEVMEMVEMAKRKGEED